jgi:hypothetical protein
MKLKVARREAKESTHWLELVLTYNNDYLEQERKVLLDESHQIRRILSAILIKLSS